MKKIFNNLLFLSLAFLTLIAISCNDFLDREPLGTVTPSAYLWNESDLGAYAVKGYSIFPTHDSNYPGTFTIDNNTDNQASSSYNSRWVPGEWRVSQTGGSWDFSSIRNCNYFIETVVPRWKAGKITGNAANVNHYIGEMYFLRAYSYFDKLNAFGDFPIVKNTLTDDKESLIVSSKRRPRNEVARFIISDLDSAITLLQTNPPGGTNRLTKNAALLFKSRVALFEATWEKYHQGTAFVPGGPGWPGTGKVDNFSINIPNEINYFLDQAMSSSSAVADAVALVSNTKDNGYNSSKNPYFMMFGDFSLTKYPEVLFWKSYNLSLGVTNVVNHFLNYVGRGGNAGYTNGFVGNFVMQNGLPIYAAGSGYAGDDLLSSVKKDRDNRLQLFMKIPGEVTYTDVMNKDGSPVVEGYPNILDLESQRCPTGYHIKKGICYLNSEAYTPNVGTTGSIVFRAVEAYLNYIEASYLKNGTIDAKADKYWRQIRDRAGINPDYNITINATDMAQEAKNDFAAYSAGVLITDKILYNIRRERRCELMAEGRRYFDLKRWRALDQLSTQPYTIEGFKLFGPMKDWYKGLLVEAGTPGKTANVSSSSESLYLRPYRINLTANNLVKDGYKWTAAHYLEPIAIQHFLITATNPSDLTTSIIYQNPGWPLEANSGATGY